MSSVCDRTYFKNVNMHEMLDLINSQCHQHLKMKGQNVQGLDKAAAKAAITPEVLLKVAGGQFINFYKELHMREQVYQVKCPRQDHSNPSSDSEIVQRCMPESCIAYHMIEQPYPLLIMLDLNWSLDDLTSKNCLTVLASLPALFFLPNIYELKNVYKLEIY